MNRPILICTLVFTFVAISSQTALAQTQNATQLATPQATVLPPGATLPQTTDSGVNLTNNSSTTNSSGSGVNLVNTHPVPLNVKAGIKFEIYSTVVNNSPGTITLPSGPCSSPLTAFFNSFNVVIRHTQGCTATSTPFQLNSGEQVTVAGPASGTEYQAVKAGKTPATVTVYYLAENGQPQNLTKPFVFTIN
jgi:hypothetical protein